jgi:hypothetical protein
MINLNSTTIVLKSLRITASQELASDDASGQSSSTDVAETGTKAKMLMASGNVLFTQAENLTQLFELAEATENGARVIYRISNKTAEALGVKQVRFASKIEAVEQQTTRQWSVSFTLQEYRSVPQKVEERQPDAAANQQGASATGESGFQYASLQQNLTDNFGSLRS